MVSAVFTAFFEQRCYVSGFPLARQLAKQEGLIDFNRAYTGCPKSSFLFFMSLYFSTIEVVKQIIEAKVVSFNLIHYFHTRCPIF